MIADARRSSPENYLRRHYGNIEVNRRANSIAIEGVMRLEFKSAEGRWVAWDWQAKLIGDNIDVVRFTQPEISFPDAVFQLTGVQADVPTHVARTEKPVEIRRPSIPYERGRGAGRDYLREVRGISPETILAAEQAGMVRYLDNAVMFTGRDEANSIRSATLRHIRPVILESGKLVTKRDLSDSDKAFPPVLPGDPVRVVIVEGGVNALAVRDLSLRAGREPPTVIATGGVGVRKWVTENPELRLVMERAKEVTIVGEHEVRDGKLDPKKQAETDAFRAKLAETIAEVRMGELPRIVFPPPGCKDAADWNLRQHQPDPNQNLEVESGYRM